MLHGRKVTSVAAASVFLLAACGVSNGGTDAAGTSSVAPPTTSTAPPAQPPADAGSERPPPPPGDASVGTACTGLKPQPVDNTWNIVSGGTTRTFEVHVPASYDPSKATPVVLNFHGFTSNGAQQNLLSGMDAKSDKEGFIAVHPEGIGSSWNAGACCGQAASSGIDDVGFVGDLLDALEETVCVDKHRIFATGMSNGGFLSHRLGCELSTRIAAVAPVAGVLGVPTCQPARPVPVMHFHGTLDPLVPYDGDPVVGFISVPDTFAGWATREACVGSPVQTYSNGDVACQTYETCNASSDITLCTVTGGGHTWPGGLPVPALGYTTTDINATDAMWTFFQAHPLP
jgi:polyhydroxybutyrate depolymerase